LTPAILILLTETQRLGHPALGWIVPGVIFIASFILTWMVYRHFTQKPPE
jgi:hypothetical protein